MPDLNRNPGRPVLRAGSQPQSWEASVACRTATAIMCIQCGEYLSTSSMAERMTEDMSQSMSEDMSQILSEDLSESMSKDMSERMSEKISKDMPERNVRRLLPVRLRS